MHNSLSVPTLPKLSSPALGGSTSSPTLPKRKPLSGQKPTLRNSYSAPLPVAQRVVKFSEASLQRALAGLRPEADAVDVGALAALESRFQAFAALNDAPPEDFIGAAPRPTKQLRRLGQELSLAYNELGMACLERSPAVAHDCLTRAMRSAPRDHALHATSWSNLGVCAARRGKNGAAMRCLRRATMLDEVRHKAWSVVYT